MNELIPTPDEEAPAPTQVELYDDLKRIGELEDQKNTIQVEIDEKTEGLRKALKHIDQGSLLYQMLSAALAPPAPAKAAPARKTTKKTTKRSKRSIKK